MYGLVRSAAHWRPCLPLEMVLVTLSFGLLSQSCLESRVLE